MGLDNVPKNLPSSYNAMPAAAKSANQPGILNVSGEIVKRAQYGKSVTIRDIQANLNDPDVQINLVAKATFFDKISSFFSRILKLKTTYELPESIDSFTKTDYAINDIRMLTDSLEEDSKRINDLKKSQNLDKEQINQILDEWTQVKGEIQEIYNKIKNTKLFLYSRHELQLEEQYKIPKKLLRQIQNVDKQMRGLSSIKNK
jgi:hypothetical protein